MLLLLLLLTALSFSQEALTRVGLQSARVVLERGKEYYLKLTGGSKLTCADCHGPDGESLKGAYARMPRFYTDLGRVADADLRVLSCLRQYLRLEDERLKSRERELVVPLVGFVASLSNGELVFVELRHPEEKRLYELGRTVWYRRSGATDFSCALCHERLAGKQFFAEVLPAPIPDRAPARYPAYSVKRDELLTLEDKLRDCFERYLLYDPKKGRFSFESRVRKPPYYVEELIALELFLMHSVNGSTLSVPGVIK
ncbi:MAG: sulfur oxidation c-type cytochrome SoxA [Aquificae bacterium]|nr:sulfur oxidation c-type cytochrome SoxA [Aquificota bacterium]